MSPVSLFFVTTSPCREWVICAPAAFLGCGSRFSGSLSGIEPWFPVTRYNHGRRRTYHRQLIRQTFEGCVAGTETVRSAKSYSESPRSTAQLASQLTSIGFDLIKAPLPFLVGTLFACISSRITTVIQVMDCTIQGTITDLMSLLRFHLNVACTETCMA